MTKQQQQTQMTTQKKTVNDETGVELQELHGNDATEKPVHDETAVTKEDGTDVNHEEKEGNGQVRHEDIATADRNDAAEKPVHETAVTKEDGTEVNHEQKEGNGQVKHEDIETANRNDAAEKPVHDETAVTKEDRNGSKS